MQELACLIFAIASIYICTLIQRMLQNQTRMGETLIAMQDKLTAIARLTKQRRYIAFRLPKEEEAKVVPFTKMLENGNGKSNEPDKERLQKILEEMNGSY